MFQDPEDVSHYKGRAYVIILAIIDDLQEFLIHLETNEDVFVPPYPLGAP